jgi:tetratricopeptide (TPR) repeat protein/tRNA A-37 threonylcarbamoyl transferase component Bud32
MHWAQRPVEAPSVADPPRNDNPAPVLTEALARALTRFWDERQKGRSVSVDECLETSPGTSEHQTLRATAITLIAQQAAGRSGAGVGGAEGAEPAPEPQAWQDSAEMATVLTPVGGESSSPSAGGMSGTGGNGDGPLPAIEGYDLVSCLGRGGMGAVYEGYQQSTGRRVAVKFMLDAIGASASARKRFEREVEVVARLQHPGIVSVIDSGVRRGRYFYAMEYVAGRPLDAAMEPGACGVRPALELIARVCDAVDYAHQRGVLHRDLKPSNIIVDDREGGGLPHLLDFGLAKVFDPSSSDGGTHGALGLTVSGPGQLLGTVAYMSPEQAQGRHDETSVRTDVYALGAIAYELLTGKLPCGTGGSLREVLARITEQDPAAPTTLRQGLTRDLDAVILRALEKIPERRYPTAGEFAADIRRALANEPVLARRVSTAGRAWRWVRRNRAISAVTAAAILALVVVSAVLVTRIVAEARHAAHEAQQAKGTTARLRGILESVDPEKSPGLTVLQLLDSAAKGLDDLPPEQDVTEAEIREVLGTVYRKYGEYTKAKDSQAKALVIRERHAQDRDAPEVADDLHNLAAILWWDGAYDQAEPLYVRSLEMRRRLFKGDHKDVATSLTHLAACRLRIGKLNDARDLYQQALAMRRRLNGAEHEDVASALNNLAKCYLETDNFDQAEKLFRDALDMIRRVRGDAHTGTAAASQNLADCLLRRAEAAEIEGDSAAAAAATDGAVEAFERALAIRTNTFPNGHHLVAASQSGLARAQLKRGRLSEAHALAESAVKMFRKTRRPDHPDLADGLGTQGTVLAAEGDFAGAAVALEQAVVIAEKVRPPAEVQVARLRGELGLAYMHLDRPEDAEQVLLRSFREIRRLRAQNAADTVLAARRLVDFYTLRGNPERATEYRLFAKLAPPPG